jgi:type II secretory pathway pseudopilin PulG
MIVAIFIFSIVVTIASGAMLSMISANRKAQALKTVMNNVNLALDSMSRDIRFGTNYTQTGITSVLCTTCTGLQLTKGPVTTQYFLSAKGTLVRKRDALEQELTATGAVIQSLDFSVSSDDTKVQVMFSGYAGKDSGDTQNRFDIQTTMTQRNL